MRRKILSLLLVAALAVAAAYLLRDRLASAALDMALRGSGVALLELQGLEFDHGSLAIGRLVVGVGAGKAPQALEGLRLGYSLRGGGPATLSIDRATVTPPDGGGDRAAAPPGIGGLVSQLLAVPLGSLSIGSLSVDGFALPVVRQPLNVAFQWRKSEFRLQLQDGAAVLHLRLRGAPATALQGDVALKAGEEELIALALQLESGAEQGLWRLQGTGRLAAGPLAAFLAPVAPLPAPLTAVHGQLPFEFSARLDDSLSAHAPRRGSVALLPAAALELALAGAGDPTPAAPVEVSFPQGLTLSLAPAGEGETVTVDWAPGQLLHAEGLRRGDTRLRQVALVADSPGKIEYRFSDGHLGGRADRLQLLLPSVSLPQLNLATRVTLSDVSLSKSAGTAMEASAKLGMEGIDLQRPRGWSPTLALQSEITLSGGQLRAAGRLYSDRRKRLLDFVADHDLVTGRGRGDFRAGGIAFDSGAGRLSRYFSRWPYTWDLYQGEVSLDTGIDWQVSGKEAGIRAALALQWDDLAGVYVDIGFVGWSGNLPGEFRAPEGFVTPEDATFRIAQLEVGVSVESIRGRFRLDAARQQLNLREFEAMLFGGRIWTGDTLYRADRDANRIDIGVDGLQLSQLLASTGYDAVEATGNLSGLLPLDVGAAGITMQRGMLAASAPGGVFRYRGALAPDANPAVAQAIAALRNYHYSVFQTEADYLQSGDLELRMVLRGHNPDMAQARPIHLNLNVSDNIPKLLRSLRSGRDIADIVSRHLGGGE
jgi:hypothetical protein